MKKKLMVIIASVLFFNVLNAYPVLAAKEEYISIVKEHEIMSYGDVIVYRYRNNNGVVQYRRWNETKKRWVDPYWINVE